MPVGGLSLQNNCNRITELVSTTPMPTKRRMNTQKETTKAFMVKHKLCYQDFPSSDGLGRRGQEAMCKFTLKQDTSSNGQMQRIVR